MDAAIKVGNEISMREAAEPVGTQIIAILAAIGEHRIDRETGIKALEVLGSVASISNINFSDVNITYDPDGGPT